MHVNATAHRVYMQCYMQCRLRGWLCTRPQWGSREEMAEVGCV